MSFFFQLNFLSDQLNLKYLTFGRMSIGKSCCYSLSERTWLWLPWVMILSFLVGLSIDVVKGLCLWELWHFVINTTLVLPSVDNEVPQLPQT